MAVKMRKLNIKDESEKLCNSCRPHKKGPFDEIGFGSKTNIQIVRLCESCMHETLQKLIYLGTKHNGVQ